MKEGYALDPVKAKVTKAETIDFKAIQGERRIKAVQELDGISVFVDQYTSEELLALLPATVTVTLDDGGEAQLTVEWQQGEYDRSKSGKYTLKGELQLEPGLINPDGLEAEIEVLVRNAEEVAEELLDTLEKEMPGPDHYSEIEGYDLMFVLAEMAIDMVEDPVKQYQFQQRLTNRKDKYDQTLQDYVDAVASAAQRDELLKALQAFWDTDKDLIEVYEWLVESKEVSDVHKIQSNVIEKAWEIHRDWAVTKEIIDAALEGEPEDFGSVLAKHRAYFQHVNLDGVASEATVVLYWWLISQVASPGGYLTIADLQAVIDAVNMLAFYQFTQEAFSFDTDRETWEMASEQLEYLLDENEKQVGRALLAEMDLRLRVYEAETAGDLYTALLGVQINYVHVPLLEEYLSYLGGVETVQAASNADLPWLGQTEEDFLQVTMAEFEDWARVALEFHRQQIQELINKVNEGNADDLLQAINEITQDTPEENVLALLEKLDATTPIVVDGEYVDFNLRDGALDFQRDRMKFYVEALAGSEVQTIEDVKGAISSGNDLFFSQFDTFVVEAPGDAKVGQPLEFLLRALDKRGNPCGDLDDFYLELGVLIDADHWDDYPDVKWLDSGVWKVTADIVYSEITENVVAKLSVRVDGGGVWPIYEGTLVTDPFLVDADAEHLLVTTDAVEYQSGDTISVTVTLQYEADGKSRKVHTFNGLRRGQVLITDGSDAGYAEFYNREFEFVNGVATVLVTAREANKDELTVQVLLPDVSAQPSAADRQIKIKPGDPAWLEASWVNAVAGHDIELLLQDAWRQTLDFTADRVKVEIRVYPAERTGLTSLSLDVPDREGMAFVDFNEGVGVVKFAGSPLAEELKKLVESGEKLALVVGLSELDFWAELPYPVED